MLNVGISCKAFLSPINPVPNLDSNIRWIDLLLIDWLVSQMVRRFSSCSFVTRFPWAIPTSRILDLLCEISLVNLNSMPLDYADNNPYCKLKVAISISQHNIKTR